MRLIDADKLIKEGWVLERHGESNRFITRKSIADVPTAELTKVYAEWIEVEKSGHLDATHYNVTPKYRCSNCNSDALSTIKESRGHGDYCVEYQWLITKFCPNCGAAMRGC